MSWDFFFGLAFGIGSCAAAWFAWVFGDDHGRIQEVRRIREEEDRETWKRSQAS